MEIGQAAGEFELGRLIDEAPISGLQGRIIALCSLASFLDGYDIQALGVAIPRMSEDFGIAPTAFAPAVSGSLIGVALGAMLLAPLADRLGRRPTLISMMVVIGLTTFGALFAPGPGVLTFWRVLTGLGLGGAVPIAVSMAAEYAPARRRVALVTLVIACVALGSFAAGMVAPALDFLWGWRAIFGVGAILPLFAAALFLVALPESLRFLIVHGTHSEQFIRQLGRISPGFAGSVAAMAVPSPAGRASVRALFGPVYRLRTSLLWLIFWFNLFTAYSLISWLPTLLHSAGWPHGAAQRAAASLALGGIAGGLLIAWLADRGQALPAVMGAYIGAAALLFLFVVGSGSTSTWAVLLLLVGICTFGALMGLGSISAAFYYPAELRSTGVGWYNGIGRLGAIAGPMVLAGLMSAGWASSRILGFLTIPMLICAGGVLLLPRALRVRA